MAPTKRNIEQFPLDFMFQLTAEKFANLRSQFVPQVLAVVVTLSLDLDRA
ncbi:ORF6N domain-containing protein [Polaromonas sp.]